MSANSTFDLINAGRSSTTPKLKFNIPKLDEVLFGIKQRHTYLLGGDTGTGKTSFTRSVFIDNVYEQFLAVNDTDLLDVLFVDCSLEVPKEMNYASTITRLAYKDYQKVIPPNKMFSWSTPLSEDDNTIVTSYREYINGMSRKMIVVDNEINPTQFHDILMEVALRNGSFSREGRFIDDCGDYTPNNPNLHVIVTFDTLNLAALDSGHTTVKSSIDRISRIGLRFRNKCNFIFVPIQQFNSDLATTDRARFGIQGPILKDFMDSTGPTKDAMVILGLYSPMRYLRDDQTIWRGYDVAQLKSWLVSVHIMKNRYGQAQKYAALKFDGALGMFTQLKDASLMTPQDYDLATRH